MGEENASVGEIEIERVPTRMIEARSKDLVPLFDYLHAPKFQQIRCAEVLCIQLLIFWLQMLLKCFVYYVIHMNLFWMQMFIIY